MATTGIESTLLREALARVDRAMNSGVPGASIAYELSQPLCAIVASAAACTRWLSAEPPNRHRVQRALERIVNECRRAGEIIDGFRLRDGKR